MDQPSCISALLLVLLAFVPGLSGARATGGRHSGLPQAMIGSMGWSTGRFSVSRTQASRIDMRITAIAVDDSDRIEGRGLWEVTVFGSEHPEGSGPRYNQARNILSQQQENLPLYPGRELVFDVEFNFMMGQIGCDRVNYLCVELAKGARANPDFEIPSSVSRNSIRNCQERSCPFDDELPRALMTNIGFSAGSGANDAPRGKVNMDITATVQTHQDSARITGTDLWRLGVFGSQQTDGSGRRLNEMRNILSDALASKPLIPGRDLVLAANANLNLQGIGTGEDYPYLCMEFAKGDSPNPDFDLPMTSGSIVSCSTIQGTPADSGNPRVMLQRFQSSYRPGDSNRDGTRDLTVEATVTPDPASDPISGTNLWRLGLFGSPNEQGTGRRYPVSDQILVPPATNKPLRPNRPLEFMVTDNVDLRALGPGTHYPFLCIEFGKNQNARPDYDLELGEQETVITCQRMAELEDHPDGQGGNPHGGNGGNHGTGGNPGGGHGRPDDRPRALVSRFAYDLGTRPVPSSHLTDVEVTATVTPFDSTDTIRGRNLWRLGLFGSRNADGSGPRMAEVRQMLPNSETGKTLQSGTPLVVEGTTRTDMRGVGEGTGFPYVCVEFGPASDDPFFDFPVNPGPTLKACRLYEGHSGGGGGGDPDMPQVLLRSFRAGIVPTAVPNSHLTRVEIETTSIPDDRTDYVPDAQFRLGIFGNAMDDGTGPRVNEVRQILAPEDRTHPVYAGRDVELNAVTEADLRGMGAGTDYPYLCVELDKKNDYVNFEMPMSTATGTFVTCYEYTPPDTPDHGGNGGGGGGEDLPVAQISNMRNALEFVVVPGSDLLETTLTSTVTPHASSDRIPASGSPNWRIGIFGNANRDGSGRRKKEVPQVLSREQQRLPMYPSRPIEFVATKELDLNGIGEGTSSPYLCFEFSKADGNNEFLFPQDTIVSCSEFTPPAPHPEPEPNPQVTITGVVPDKNVKGKEKGTADVTFDVVVNVDPSSDQVHGSGLWNMKVWASKKKNGKGPKLGEVAQVLDRLQQAQTIQNGKKIPFRDVSMTLDLSGVKCKDAKYLCAEISQGSSQSFTLAAPVAGCQKLKCQKNKKSKPSSGTTLAIRSITPTRVSIFDGQEYYVRFNQEINFDPGMSDPLTRGVRLWKLSSWFNSAPDASNKYAKVDQQLSPTKRDKYVRDVSSTFRFGEIEFQADLRELNCRQLRYFCIKLTLDDPSPPFTLEKVEDNANIGCSRTTCR